MLIVEGQELKSRKDVRAIAQKVASEFGVPFGFAMQAVRAGIHDRIVALVDRADFEPETKTRRYVAAYNALMMGGEPALKLDGLEKLRLAAA